MNVKQINAKNPVSVIHYSRGIVATFNSYFDLLYYINQTERYGYRLVERGIGTHHIQYDSVYFEKYYDYIVRDRFGTVFTKEQLQKDVKNVPVHIETVAEYPSRYSEAHCQYRYDPVPRTGRGNKCHGHYYRHPKTTSEMKCWEKFLCDCDELPCNIHIVTRRSMDTLPSIYDDQPILRVKNWKSYRKTRYKLPKESSGV